MFQGEPLHELLLSRTVTEDADKEQAEGAGKIQVN